MSLQKKNPTTTKAWHALEKQFEKEKNIPIKAHFEDNPQRFDQFSWSNDHMLVDYSKNRVSQATLSLLTELAQELDLADGIQKQFNGEPINETEGRSVLHVALRNRSNRPIVVDGEDVMPEVNAVLHQMRVFCEEIHSGSWKGFTGKRIKHIVNIGIGGSDLGPYMVTEALKAYQLEHIETHFVSNVDGSDIAEAFRRINAEETLFIIASKSFTTQETMRNAHSARSWFLAHGGSDKDVKKHFVALSTNENGVKNFGIDTRNMFRFWDWVGGRFSMSSAIGLSIALTIGYKNFERLLDGMHEMDEHFRTADFDNNIPVILALIGIWYNNFYKFETEAILPYDHYLGRFAAYFQQGNMESNGKSVDRNGEKVEYETGPIIWGEPGTNGQHAFFQLIHQGTKIIPCDFIAPANSQNPLHDHHELLLSNFFAQTEALMNGKDADQIKAEYEEKGIAPDEYNTILPYKIFEGNRPTNSILVDKVTPHVLGQLIAMYEHKIFVQGYIWNIYSYDQYGVQLGKELAKAILPELLNNTPISNHDSSTNGLINAYKEMRQQKKEEHGVFLLKGHVQNYAWGGYDYIPNMLGIENGNQTPFAEYWMGNHSKGPAMVSIGNEWRPLKEIVSLPYLLKVLDVRDMLSIQVHPNKAQAERGYAEENKAGIALNARNRLFKDDNHKPELMVALTDFWLLHGLKSELDVIATIQQQPSFNSLLPYINEGLAAFHKHILTMEQGEVTATLAGVKMNLSERADDLKDKNTADYWAWQAFETYGFDRGIFCIYFYNLVHLKPGEGIYQEAGLPHAYLEGRNVEIMANSDNVFRAGLTAKHVDVDALLEHIVFEAVTPQIIKADRIGRFVHAYPSPAREFELHKIELRYRQEYHCKAHSPECMLVMEGEVEVLWGAEKQRFEAGQSIYISADTNYEIIAWQNEVLIYKATVPQ